VETADNLKKLTPQRQRLIADGGHNNRDRRDWSVLLRRNNQGWYKIEFGKSKSNANRLHYPYIQRRSLRTNALEADFIIDATGLDANVTANPLLNDLVTHYNLPLNPLGRLSVSNDFELVEMRSSRGRMYAAGAITLGGPYAAVDSFLGLQYAALRAVDAIAAARIPGIGRLNFLSSSLQWLKWVANQSPS
jgi:hypothetical protein